MRELVEFLARSLVDSPDQVEVSESETPEGLHVALRVAPDDMGKIIGRGGRVIRALRAVIKAAAVRNGQRVELEVTS